MSRKNPATFQFLYQFERTDEPESQKAVFWKVILFKAKILSILIWWWQEFFEKGELDLVFHHILSAGN